MGHAGILEILVVALRILLLTGQVILVLTKIKRTTYRRSQRRIR
ncbi:MAG: hypothetical protein A4E53_01519 [Pelotomaculum sp. PtaB.Bin104]|nr:MAG: hypothetical protein A4E53_01519 [Pelotomaculum sp. PtaB.Bin104]